MASNTSLEILVKLKDEATTGLEKLGSKVGLTGGQFLALGTAVASVGAFLKSSVESAAMSEMATAKLATVLGKTTNDVEGAISRFNEYNAALQFNTGISDEVISQGEAILGTFALTEKQIKQLTPTLLDMATVLDGTNGEITDLTNIANSVGKALSSGVDVLKRYGVTMSDAQTKAFDLAKGQEKLNMLQEILNANYGGAADAAGKTYQGRMRALAGEFDNLKENIGSAFLPALSTLADGFAGMIRDINTSMGSSETFGKVLYGVAKVILGTVEAVIAQIKAFFLFNQVMVSVIEVSYNVAKSFIKNFNSMGDVASHVFAGIKDAISGNMDEAMKEFNKAAKINSFFSDVSKTVNENTTKIVADFESLKKSSKAAANDLSEAFNQIEYDKLRKASLEAAEAQKKIENALEAAAKAGKDGSAEIKKLATEYTNLATEAGDKLTQLRRDHEDKLAASQKATQALQADLVKLQGEYKRTGEEAQKSFDAQKQTDTGSLADKIVASEQNIADLKKRLSEETDEKQRADLQKQITAQEAGLSKIGDFTKTITAEITEARRRASLSEIERAVEDFVKTRKLAQDKFDADRAQAKLEFEAKQTELQAKLDQQKEQDAKELAIFTDKQTQIQSLLDAATARFNADLELRHGALTTKVKAEIELFNDLAKAVSRAYAGNLSQKEMTTITTSAAPLTPQKKFATGGIVTQPTIGLVGEAGAEAIIPLNRLGGGIGGQQIIINMNGGTYLDEKVADKIGNMILGKLKRTARI